jgi:hypothetical protein
MVLNVLLVWCNEKSQQIGHPHFFACDEGSDGQNCVPFYDVGSQ